MALLEILKKSLESINKSMVLFEEREALFRIAEARGEDRTIEREKLEEQKQKLISEGKQTMIELEKLTEKEETHHDEHDK